MNEQIKSSIFFNNEEAIIKFHIFFNDFKIKNNKNINYILFNGSKLIQIALIKDLIKWNNEINNNKYFYFKYDVKNYSNSKQMITHIFNDLFIKLNFSNNESSITAISKNFNEIINRINKRWLNHDLRIIIFIENIDDKIEMFNDFKKSCEVFSLLMSCKIILVIIWNENKNFNNLNNNKCDLKFISYAHINDFIDINKTINFILSNEKNSIISEFILNKNNNHIIKSLFLLKMLKIKYHEKFNYFISKLNSLGNKKKMNVIIDGLIFYIIYTKYNSQFNYKILLYNFRNKILIEKKMKEKIINYQHIYNDNNITYNNIILSNKKKCILPLAIYNSFFGNVFSGYLEKEQDFYYYTIKSFKPYNIFCLLIIKLKFNDFLKKILINNKNIYDEILELIFNTALKDENFFI